ncbi:hypothetical protein ACLED5_04010 [Lonsdalea quercina]|uniref:hypothetical protein n=1 Tax=Lonsdalea quercina TaxID=71657 RepID=UPI003975EB4E
MKITKEQVKTWEACTDGYRWFLDKFPEGGDYADVHQGLLNDNRLEDAGWLTEKMYQSFFGMPELPIAEASAGDKMIETLNNMGVPTVESISEEEAQQASSGNWTQQASSGDRTQQASSGNWTQQASSGNWTKQASSGYGTQQASSGDRTQQASSGDRTQQASSGDRTQQASSGDLTQHTATGNQPKVATSGEDAEIVISGNDAVVAAANSVSRVVLGEGGCASIAYHDGERTRFAVAYVGENNIKPNVAYTVNESGEFVQVED